MTVPTTQRSIIIESKGKAVIQKDAKVPALRDDYVLVRTVALSANPTDWKHIDFAGKPGSRVGCDYAGVVEDVGANLTRSYKKGDRIAGMAHGANLNNAEDGCFSEYAVVKTGPSLHIPENLSDDIASSLGVGITTVGQGLFQSLKLPLPGTKDAPKDTILIYGGSTATGTLAIQFAKLAGWTVITTCSPHNFELVKSRGADKAFDYKASDVAKQIRDYTEDKLAYVFDCISLESSAKICSDAFGKKGGKYSSLLQVKASRDDVESAMTLGYTAMGEAFSKFGSDFPALPDHYKFQVEWWTLAAKLIAEGKIKPHPIDVRPNGLQGLIEGFDLMRADKVSGKKLVVRTAETPK